MDIRYHLASLIGVFLALGIGMLMGTQLAQSGALENEQLRLAERLEASFTGLRSENRSLREQLAGIQEELAREREFADLVLGAVAQGTLAGLEVELYVPPGLEGAAERVERLLAQAGAAARLRLDAPAGPPAGDIVVVAAWPGMTGKEAAPPGGGAGEPLAAVPADGSGAGPAAPVEIGTDGAAPLALFALIEGLRTGAAPPDPAAVLVERLRP